MSHSKKPVLEEKIKKRIEEYREQIITTLCDLISIPTENPPGQSYKECVDYLSSKLKELKI
ncbi:MAG: hypothetical protein ACETWK_07250, partial [Candidatus Aminicenantaceae bacterium]